MAKKSQHGRNRPALQSARSAERKPQTPDRAGSATLVRAPSAAAQEAAETPSAANVVADTAPATATQSASAPATAKTAVAEKPAAPKPATPKPAAPKSAGAAKPAAPAGRPAPVSTREQNQRVARARATQRARQAGLISAESYSYVVGDLKLVVGLALSAFIILIALTFVLPH